MFKLPTIATPWKYVMSMVLVLGLLASIVFGVRGCAQDERNENNQLVNTGQTIQQGKQDAKVLNNVKESRDAVDNPTNDELNSVQNRYDRNR